MSKVFFDIGVSLDGFIAGPNRGLRNPLGDGGTTIHKWMFLQQRFRQSHGLGEGGETGEDDRNLTETFDRIGANIMGKRMFEATVRGTRVAAARAPAIHATGDRNPRLSNSGTTLQQTMNARANGNTLE